MQTKFWESTLSIIMSLYGTWSCVVCTWTYWNLQSNKERTNQLLCLDAPATLTVTHNRYQSLKLNGGHQHCPAKSGRSTYTARVNRITEQDQTARHRKLIITQTCSMSLSVHNHTWQMGQLTKISCVHGNNWQINQWSEYWNFSAPLQKQK